MQRVALSEDAFREAWCRICTEIFYVCRKCDRGNVYCGEACRVTGKRADRRITARRYQQSFYGRRDHAARQVPYRAKTKVTHTGIQELAPSGSVCVDAMLPAAIFAEDTLDAPREPDVHTMLVSETDAGDDATLHDGGAGRAAPSGAPGTDDRQPCALGSTDSARRIGTECRKHDRGFRVSRKVS